MSNPLAICIEDLDAESCSGQYVQCVALPGRQPGLRLDAEGRVTWLNAGMAPEVLACELWVSADGRLVLYRPEGAAAVTVRREGRSLDAPCGKPVILLDKDRVDVGSRHLRIHIHGTAPAIAAPAPLKAQPRPLERLAKGAAAAAAVIGAATACIEVRTTPPEVAPWTETPTSTIEVRDFPPEVAMPTQTPTIEVIANPPSVVITPTPPVVGSVEGALIGPWTVAQTYAVEGSPVFKGTLTFVNGLYYSFDPLTAETRPDAEGTLNFLFDAPWGGMTVAYADGVAPESPLVNFAPGTVLATCSFHDRSTALGEFQIVVGTDGGLYFAPLSGTAADWQITR